MRLPGKLLCKMPLVVKQAVGPRYQCAVQGRMLSWCVVVFMGGLLDCATLKYVWYFRDSVIAAMCK